MRRFLHTIMPPKRKRPIEVSTFRGDEEVEPLHEVHRTVHRRVNGRISQYVHIHKQTPEPADDDQDANTHVHENYIQDASTADFVDEDYPAIDSGVDVPNAELDDGDDQVCALLSNNYLS